MIQHQILQSPDGDAGGSAPGVSADPVAPGMGTNAPPGSSLFPDDGEPGGGPAKEQDEQPKGDEAQAGSEPATEAIRSPGITKADIDELVSSITAVRQAPAEAQTQQQQEPLTQDQLDQMFNVWKPSEEFLAQLRNESPEVQQRAFIALRDGLVRQVMSMSNYWFKQQLESAKQELTGRIEPLHEFVSEARATAFRDDFFELHPELEEYESLVDAVAAKLYQSGGDEFLKLDRAARMKLFATESKKLVDQFLAKGGGASASTGGNGGKGGQQPPTRRMSTLTSGGQPGSRGAGGGKPTTGNKHVDDGLAALD